MFTRIYLSLVLLAAVPAWSQVSGGGATDISSALSGEPGMRTPPPVSDESYPTAVGAETLSNYLNAGLVVITGYTDNVALNSSDKPAGDVSYSIRPTVSLDQTTSRFHQTLTYSPGFTFYNHTSQLNEADQGLSVGTQYRFSPHVTGSLHEEFRKSSNAFNTIESSGGSVSGSAQTPVTALIAPVADQLNNNAGGQLTYQFSMNDMVGGSATFSTLRYGDSTQVSGLSNSDLKGGAVFYSRRISNGQYFGATYQYSNIAASAPITLNNVATTVQTETQTQSLLFFFTVYFGRNVSVSISAGPQHSDVAESPLPSEKSLSPAVVASFGWQGRHTSLSASYAQLTAAGGGLLGAYHANSASAAARWQVSRSWTFGSSAGYMNTDNISQSMESFNPGGHTLSGSVTAQHPINQRFSMEFGYTRLHQSYQSIAYIANTPDVGRAYVSLSYQFSRPLGR